MSDRVFPGETWDTVSPAEAGFSPAKLSQAKQWLDDHMADQRYRFAIVRGGRLVVEWNHQLNADTRLGIASAAKSVYSNVLGIVVSEGTLPSADARVVDYYPEMMDVPEDGGPKPGRYAFEKDRDITFRQLISNTSGYMKPGEEPGKVFHYQTYGMNILTHSLAKIHGYYDVADPEGSPGFGRLIDEKLAQHVGIRWTYSLNNFKLQESARLPVFGYYCSVNTNALDFARLGWLWCNWGRWEDKQIIPDNWLRESIQTAPNIVNNCPEDDWRYGLGFWTNDHGKLWPGLPMEGFTASGAGGHYLSVFPQVDLVIVQNPGRYGRDSEGDPTRGNAELLKIVLDALEGE